MITFIEGIVVGFFVGILAIWLFFRAMEKQSRR